MLPFPSHYRRLVLALKRANLEPLSHFLGDGSPGVKCPPTTRLRHSLDPTLHYLLKQGGVGA